MADTISFTCPNKDAHIEITNTDAASAATSHWDGDVDLMKQDETIYFISDSKALKAFEEEVNKIKGES
jgi:ribulose 1,5-bisphosphate carboxylase large subunit-like protein